MVLEPQQFSVARMVLANRVSISLPAASVAASGAAVEAVMNSGLSLLLGLELGIQMIHKMPTDMGFCLLLLGLGQPVHTSGLHITDPCWSHFWRRQNGVLGKHLD